MSIETNWQDAKAALEATNLEEGDQLGSVDVKSLDTNVSLEEAIEIPLKEQHYFDLVLEDGSGS